MLTGRLGVRCLAGTAAVMLPLGLLVAAPAADAAQPVEGEEILGLIVAKATPTVSDLVLETAVELEGVEATVAMAITDTIAVIDFDEPMTEAAAEPLAEALQARPDVVAVEPNRRVSATTTPVIPDDPRFPEQWDMWAGGGPSDFGTRAADIWGIMRGSDSVVVGVIDSGYTVHPDLVGTTVPGFDFISDPASARDGNAWDSDPADEGDWCPRSGARSSWHGTHVAGTINAIQDNAIGVTGLAPAVRVQHLRALGECGQGTGADVLAAVVWGSGGDLKQWIPASSGEDPGINPTPASVLNLSLGGPGRCDVISQQVFNEARARGTTVVVAAGNETVSVGDTWPASCLGVVSVGSSTREGDLSDFSNYGVAPGQLALSAPGSDILSTYNRGATTPGAPDYASRSGTSMAAPHAAAAAALLYSMGVTSPTDVDAALRASVRPFGPQSACDVIRCGAGILDVSKLAAQVPGQDPGPPTQVMAVPGDRRVTVSWTPPSMTGGSPLVSATAVASPGGQTCTTAASGCRITGLANGQRYRVSVTVTNADGRTSAAATSARFTPAAAPGRVRQLTHSSFTRQGNAYRVTVRWQPPASDGGAPVDGYLVRLRDGNSWSSWRTVSRTFVRIDSIKPGKKHTVHVRATNSSGSGPRASYTFRAPRR